MRLNATAKAVDEARTREGFDVVKDDGYAGAEGFQQMEDTRKIQREAASGPGEGGVLHQYPGIAPARRLKSQRTQRLTPAVKFPRHAADLQLKIVRLESSIQIAAIFLDGVRGLV